MNSFFSNDDINSLKDKISLANEKAERQQIISAMRSDILHTAEIFLEACREYPVLAKNVGIMPEKLPYSLEPRKIQKKSFFGKTTTVYEDIVTSDPVYPIGYVVNYNNDRIILSVNPDGEPCLFDVLKGFVNHGYSDYYSKSSFHKDSLLISDSDIEDIIRKNNTWSYYSYGIRGLLLYCTYETSSNDYASGQEYYLSIKRADDEIRRGIKKYFLLYAKDYKTNPNKKYYIIPPVGRCETLRILFEED